MPRTCARVYLGGDLHLTLPQKRVQGNVTEKLKNLTGRDKRGEEGRICLKPPGRSCLRRRALDSSLRFLDEGETGWLVYSSLYNNFGIRLERELFPGTVFKEKFIK